MKQVVKISSAVLALCCLAACSGSASNPMVMNWDNIDYEMSTYQAPAYNLMRTSAQ